MAHQRHFGWLAARLGFVVLLLTSGCADDFERAAAECRQIFAGSGPQAEQHCVDRRMSEQAAQRAEAQREREEFLMLNARTNPCPGGVPAPGGGCEPWFTRHYSNGGMTFAPRPTNTSCYTVGNMLECQQY